MRAVLRELPATLAELSERTGYPVGRVLGYIGEARAAGIAIAAIGQKGHATTYTAVDSTSQKEETP